MFEVLKKIDASNPVSPESDKVVEITKEIAATIFDLIEN